MSLFDDDSKMDIVLLESEGQPIWAFYNSDLERMAMCLTRDEMQELEDWIHLEINRKPTPIARIRTFLESTQKDQLSALKHVENALAALKAEAKSK